MFRLFYSLTILFFLSNSCQIKKTKLYYIYNASSDSLTGIYNSTTYDAESGNVTEDAWNETISGPILNVPDLTNYSCPSGWIQFSRTTYNYCFYITQAYLYDWSTSEKACQRINANLAGFQTSDERIGIANRIPPASSIPTWNSDNDKYGSYWWIGASRKTGSNCVAGSSTAPSLYNWTDGETTGTDGMKWGTAQPDCSGTCVALRMAGTLNVADNKTLDDVSCTLGIEQDVLEFFLGYICGQNANLL